MLYSLLTTLHTFLNAVSFGIELAILGILALSWILGHVHAEYTATLKRPNAAGLVIARLCGFPIVLLSLGMGLDSVWYHNYAKLPLIGGLLLGTLIVMNVAQWLGQRAAHQVLLADGYDPVPTA